MPIRFIVPRRTFVALVAAAIALGVGIWAWLYLPHASITVYPATVQHSVTVPLALSSKIEAPDFKAFAIPARIIEKTVAEEQSFTRQGAVVQDDFAKGKVTLINDQEEEQPLLPKTHLRHDQSGAYFLTDAAITIPPKNKAQVSVTAKEKGASGNVGAGKFTVDRLPAALQKTVYAESTQPMTGGLATDSPLTDQEIETAKKTVAEAAKKRLLGEMTAEAGGAHIREDLLNISPESEAVSAAAGSATQTFSVQTTVKGSGFVADQNDLLSMAVLALRSKSDTDHELVSYDPASFSVKIKRSDFERGEASVEGALSGTFAARISPDVFQVTNLAGRSKSETEDYFRSFPTVGRVEVAFSPFWVRAIPSRVSATQIVVKNAQ